MGINMLAMSPVLENREYAWMTVGKSLRWCTRWAATGRKWPAEILVLANREMALIATT